MWHRIIWRGSLQEPLRSRLPAPDAFDDTIAALAKRLGPPAARRQTGGARLPPAVGERR